MNLLNWIIEFEVNTFNKFTYLQCINLVSFEGNRRGTSSSTSCSTCSPCINHDKLQRGGSISMSEPDPVWRNFWNDMISSSQYLLMKLGKCLKYSYFIIPLCLLLILIYMFGINSTAIRAIFYPDLTLRQHRILVRNSGLQHQCILWAMIMNLFIFQARFPGFGDRVQQHYCAKGTLHDISYISDGFFKV